VLLFCTSNYIGPRNLQPGLCFEDWHLPSLLPCREVEPVRVVQTNCQLRVSVFQGQNTAYRLHFKFIDDCGGRGQDRKHSPTKLPTNSWAARDFPQTSIYLFTKRICGIRNLSSISSFSTENFAGILSHTKPASDRNLYSVINLQLNLPVLREDPRNSGSSFWENLAKVANISGHKTELFS
jgi:hypothetical protein